MPEFRAALTAVLPLILERAAGVAIEVGLVCREGYQNEGEPDAKAAIAASNTGYFIAKSIRALGEEMP